VKNEIPPQAPKGDVKRGFGIYVQLIEVLGYVKITKIPPQALNEIPPQAPKGDVKSGLMEFRSIN